MIFITPTHGYACRALIQSLVSGTLEKVRRMDAGLPRLFIPAFPFKR